MEGEARAGGRVVVPRDAGGVACGPKDAVLPDRGLLARGARIEGAAVVRLLGAGRIIDRRHAEVVSGVVRVVQWRSREAEHGQGAAARVDARPELGPAGA